MTKMKKAADSPLSLNSLSDVPGVLAELLRRAAVHGTPSKAHVQAMYSRGGDHLLLLVSFDGRDGTFVIGPSYQDAGLTDQLLDAVDESLGQLNGDAPAPPKKPLKIRIIGSPHRVIDRNVRGPDGRVMPPMLMSHLREGAYRLGMRSGDDGPNPNPGIFIAQSTQTDEEWQAQSIAIHDAQARGEVFSPPVPQCPRRVTVKPLDPTESLAVHERLKEQHSIKADQYQPMREATPAEIERLGPISQPFIAKKATKLEAGDDA
jgi:hypothetical protein